MQYLSANEFPAQQQICTKMLSATDLMLYIARVRNEKNLQNEIENIQKTLQFYHQKLAKETMKKEDRLNMIHEATIMFRVLLTEKARQEHIDKMRKDYCGATENGSTGQRDDTTGGICLGEVLQ